jgi:hypothetical protein
MSVPTPTFTTLTEFFAYLSVNDAGNTYYKLLDAAAYPPTPADAVPNRTSLANFLKTYLDPNSDGFNQIINTCVSDKDFITDTVDDEQTSKITATFTNATLIWAIPKALRDNVAKLVRDAEKER